MSLLDMHLTNIQNETEFDIKEMGIGDIVKFTYKGTERYAFVLNTGDSKGLVHALTLEKTTPQMLYRFKFLVGENIDEDPQTVYNTYIAKDSSFKSADNYRTFDSGKMGKISVLDYRFGLGGREKLISYGSIRDFTEDEYTKVAYDYFLSPYIQQQFPKLANTAKELVASLKEARIEQMDETYLKRLENSSASMVINAPDPLRTAMNWGKRRGETLFGVKEVRVAMSNGAAVPPGVVISYEPDNRFLLNGDVRMCIGIAKGYNLGVKILNYSAIQRETTEKRREKEPTK